MVGGQVGSVLCRDLPPRSARGGGGQGGRDGGAAPRPRGRRSPLAQLWPAQGPRGGRMGTVPVTADRGTSTRHGDSLQQRRERRHGLGTRHACSVNPEMTRHIQPQPRPLRAGSQALEARGSAPWPIPPPGRLLAGQCVSLSPTGHETCTRSEHCHDKGGAAPSPLACGGRTTPPTSARAGSPNRPGPLNPERLPRAGRWSRGWRARPAVGVGRPLHAALREPAAPGEAP